MGLLGMGVKGIAVLVLVTAFAVYVTYPPPQMSNELLAWLTKGSYFKYKEHSIFFREGRIDPSSTGPTLILLHGFPTLGYDWFKMWNGLIRSFDRVVAIDFLGFGFSDKPKGYQYTIAEQADLYEALLAELGVSEAHVLAHDYGDTVAQEMLARFNEGSNDDGRLVIKSVCLLNGGIFPETNKPMLLQKLLAVPILGDIVTRLSNRVIFKRGMRKVFGEKTQPSSAEMNDFYSAVRVKDGQNVLPQLLDYIRQRSLNKNRWTSALQETSVPVHVIWGLDDPVNPSGFVDFYKKTVPRGGITVLPSNVGHYPHWEEPARVLDAYLKFVDSCKHDGKND